MEFGSLLRNSKRHKQSRNSSHRRTFSASNLSTCSSTTTNSSTTFARKSVYITLPQNLGAEIDSNGRVFHMVKGGVAQCSGVIQVGDYVQIVEKDEAEELISLKVTFGILHIEQRPTFPFVIEIGNRSQTSLGIALSDSPGNKIRISSILPGSLMDRCGFIRAGDVLTSIHIDQRESVPCSPYYSSRQVAEILRNIVQNSVSVTLTILPDLTATTSLCNTSSYRTLIDDEEENDDTSSEISSLTLRNEQMPFLKNDCCNYTCKNEPDGKCIKSDGILHVCLWKDFLYEDWGFSIVDDERTKENEESGQLDSASSEFPNNRTCGTLVHEIRPGGSAVAAGLKPGDKILQINGRDVSNLKSTMIVPILASLEDSLNLVIFRNLI